MWVTSSLAKVLTPAIAALGNFDGVHRGHQRVIQPVLDVLPPAAGRRPYPSVVTFHPHPQEFFSGQPRALLTPLNEKVAQFERLGIEQMVLLPFDRELANLTPQAFVEDLLVRQLQVQFIAVGADFCFGRQRSGTVEDLRRIAGDFGIEVAIAPLERTDGERISSSAIRQALEQGQLAIAHRLLGRPYSLTGAVVTGQQLGRQLGFPTANLQLPPEKFLPRFGVYAVRVQSATDATTAWLPGVMNLGYRPTVDGTRLVSEVHILDWDGDLYGQTLTVTLEKFLRPEQKFASPTALRTQIAADCDQARSVLAQCCLPPG